MDWDDVKVFLAVVDAGSLRSAAGELKVSQPTVGRRLAALEAAAGGGPLFERTPQGHVVTARGSTLVDAARALSNAALAFERQVSGLTDTISGAVRLGAHEWVSQFVASQAGRFRSELPGIRLELGEMRGGSDLARRNADLGIFEGPAERLNGKDNGLVVRSLGTLGFGIYGASLLVGRGSPAHDPQARFKQCPWVAHDDMAVAAGAGEACRTPHRWLEQRIDAKTARVRCAGTAAFLAAVKAGAGLAVLPRFVGDADAGLHRLADDLKGEEPVQLWLGMHRDLRRSRCVQAVMDLLISLFKAEQNVLHGGKKESVLPGERR